MPKRKRSYTAYKKRAVRRRKIYRIRKRRRKTGRKLILGGFPSKKLVRLRYVTEITLNAGQDLYARHNFCANGLYDPDISGVGHQPNNFDRWMTIYNHYTVLGSKIVARYTPNSAPSTNAGSYFGVMLCDDGNQLDDVYAHGGISNVMEQKLNRTSKFVAGTHVIVAPCTVVKKFSAKKFFGKRTASDDAFEGDASRNPDEQAIFSVYHMAVGGNDPGEINVLVTMEFIALLTEPKEGQYS